MGKAEGKAEGKTEGLAQVLIKVLRSRGLRPYAAAMARIESEDDVAVLLDWLDPLPGPAPRRLNALRRASKDAGSSQLPGWRSGT